MTAGWLSPRVRESMERDRSTFRSIVDALYAVDEALVARAVNEVKAVKSRGSTCFFIGNGGSAAIASHMAADFLKNGVIAAQCFNDGALTTCLANDLGYEHVFAKPIELHGRYEDVLFAISSSGKSRSITLAAETALRRSMKVITLSGFDPNNHLRQLGHINFHVNSDRYGVVEVTHHAICHAILDAVMHDG
jgi:D-sedoheptulose 7-phosphate isomerase